ncbi:MAG: nucleotidyltransferase domain-containing protein [Pseudanabaena sp. ELA607]
MNPTLNNIQPTLHELKLGLKELYGDRLAYITLYGSQARNEATPDSDIDILVVLHGKVKPCDEISNTGEIISKISLQYDTVVSCLFINEKEYLNHISPLLLNIRREGINLYDHRQRRTLTTST